MPNTFFSLDALPPEILWKIYESLSPDDLLSLWNTGNVSLKTSVELFLFRVSCTQNLSKCNFFSDAILSFKSCP